MTPTGRITFRLVQADPDFLYKLGLLLAVPAPPGAPSHIIDRAPFLPGTGPYMISQLRPGKSVTLVRNPYFRQWSYAAQPAGYPSVIRYEQVKSQSAQESAVIAGQGDLAYLEEGDLQSLAIQYPARVYFLPQAGHCICLSQHPPAAVHQPQGPAGRQLRHRSRPDPAALPFRLRSGHRDVPDAPVRLPRLPALLPLYGRRRGRGLARPGHGAGATAGQGIRHEEHAGDRLEPRCSRGEGGRLLPRRAPG